MPRPLKSIIDLKALQHNLNEVRSRVPHAAILVVVKANAYGHGIERAMRAFMAADGAALLEIDAAVRLRSSGYRKRLILLEGVFDAGDLRIAAEFDLALVLHNQEQLRMLDSAPGQSRFDVLLKLNTGMNRLGFMSDAATAVIARLRAHRAVGKLTLMTHFATADEARGIAAQAEVFHRIAVNHDLPCTLANSAALLRYPQTHADAVRPGIMLYGCSPFADTPAAALGLQPAMTLASEIIAVQSIEARAQVGYGSDFAAPHAMRIGIVACGYADGYPRHAPTGTPVLVDGVHTRTVGRVAMDMLCVDLSALPQARVGTPVTLWGRGLSADEVAVAADTVSYELLCAITPRVPVVEE